MFWFYIDNVFVQSNLIAIRIVTMFEKGIQKETDLNPIQKHKVVYSIFIKCFQ